MHDVSEGERRGYAVMVAARYGLYDSKVMKDCQAFTLFASKELLARRSQGPGAQVIGS